MKFEKNELSLFKRCVVYTAMGAAVLLGELGYVGHRELKNEFRQVNARCMELTLDSSIETMVGEMSCYQAEGLYYRLR